MSADALSDVLKAVRMTGAVFFNVVARDPWVAEQCTREMVLPLILPGAGHMISYHIVTEGRCFASIIGEDESVEVHAGQAIVFTRGDPHVMSSVPGMRAEPIPVNTLDDSVTTQLPYIVSFGENGPPTVKVVCGFLVCDSHPFNPLLENLPRVLIGDSDREGETTGLGQIIRLTMEEAARKRTGGEGFLGRLAELMFIEVVRQHVERLPTEQEGWLSGLRDPYISKALSLIHAYPKCDWILEDLAKRVGISRSELAERFARHVGVPPMQYLAKWRMQVASGLLRDNVNIAAVADKVGYGSEASFSRAFKKIVGVPPSLWRDQPPMRQSGALSIAVGSL